MSDIENMDIRWQQRFQNFEKTFLLLQKALDLERPDWLQRAGLVQMFEITFDLSWKLLKDYLEYQGFKDLLSPRSTLKKAFEISLIEDGRAWLELLEQRNLTTYTYDEVEITNVTAQIRSTYFVLFQNLYSIFSKINIEYNAK